MSRVTLTINLDLEMSGLPSHEALAAAHQRAEFVAARVFLNGDGGGRMHVNVDESDHPIPVTCGALTVLSGRMNATLGSTRWGATVGHRPGKPKKAKKA